MPPHRAAEPRAAPHHVSTLHMTTLHTRSPPIRSPSRLARPACEGTLRRGSFRPSACKHAMAGCERLLIVWRHHGLG